MAVGAWGEGAGVIVEGVALMAGHWWPVRDGDARARALFHRHYSYRPYADGRTPRKIVGPGEYMVLLTLACDALFVWRRMRWPDLAGQSGVNCTVFRNEGPVLSSQLIREACDLAWARWPGARLFTYVNPRKVASTNPGYCFLKAGWRTCGVTKVNRLIILEREAVAA